MFTNDVLIDAVLKEDFDLVKVLSKTYTDLNEDYWYSQKCPLLAAFMTKNTKIIDFLLSKGASLRIKDNMGNSLLHRLMEAKDLEGAKLLIKYDRDIKLNELNSSELTPLGWAIWNRYPEGAIFLIKRGANSSLCPKFNPCVLQESASKGYSEVIETMFRYDVDGKISQEDIKNSLEEAFRKGNEKSIKVIKNRYFDIYHFKLEKAVQEENLEEIKNLLNKDLIDLEKMISFSNSTLLMYSALYKSSEVTELLLEKGADVNTKNIDGLPILSKLNDFKRLKWFVNHAEGLDLNNPDYQGITPLMYQVRKGNRDSINLLLEKGADVNFEDEDGWKALDWAVSYAPEDIVKLLFDITEDPRRQETRDKAEFRKNNYIMSLFN